MSKKTISKTEAMANEKISTLVIKFSLTTFAALFCSALYNIVDSLFVSRGVGDNAMGGVSIVYPFMIIQAAIAQTVGGGAASIVSRCLGKKENAKAGETTLNAMAVFYISAVIITIIGFVFMNPILSLLGATDDVFAYAKEYFIIVLIGNVFSTGFSSIIRAEGRMTYALMIWLIPTAVNVALDAIFIFGMHMGVMGAALATVLCQFTSFLMCVFFFAKLSCQSFSGVKIKLKTIRNIIGIGIPTLMQMGGLSIITIILNKILSITAGTLGINTFAYISKIITFGIVPFNAITQSTAPIIGYNHGAKNKDRVKETVKFSMVLCLSYSIIAFIFSRLLSEQFIKIFTDSKELISSGGCGIRIIALALPFAFVPLLTGSYFQSVGEKVKSILLNISIFAFICPIAFFAAKEFGTLGVWWSFPISCILADAVSFFEYCLYKRNAFSQ